MIRTLQHLLPLLLFDAVNGQFQSFPSFAVLFMKLVLLTFSALTQSAAGVIPPGIYTGRTEFRQLLGSSKTSLPGHGRIANLRNRIAIEVSRLLKKISKSLKLR